MGKNITTYMYTNYILKTIPHLTVACNIYRNGYLVIYIYIQ